MSSFDAETQQQQSKGPEAFLSYEERLALKRSLSFPEEYPPEMKEWLIDFMAVNIPQIPISQVVGFSQFTANGVVVNASESTTSNAYVDLATPGPELTGLSDGTYLVMFGSLAAVGAASAGVFAVMALECNGVSPLSTDLCASGVEVGASVSAVVIKTLNGGGNNTIVAKYASSDGVTDAGFDRRWLVALKIGN